MAEELIEKKEKDIEKSVDNEEIFNKIDSIISKRIDGLTKSILRDNGVEDSELKEMLTQYKAGKTQKAQDEKNNLIKLKNENEDLKKQILNNKITNVVNTKAAELGIETAQLPYVLKLANLNEVTLDDGSVDESKIEEALNQVLTDIPVLKTSKKIDKQDRSGFKNIGPDAKDDQNEDPLDKMRKIMGLK